MHKGNPSYMKQMNRRLIINYIKENETVSRATISKQLSLSKPTVSAVVDQLLKEGWILETGSGEASSSGGRKPVNLKFNPHKAYIIGVDIGGTKVAIGITDLNGSMISFSEFPTQVYLEKNLFEQIKKHVEEQKEKLNIDNSKILGMGVGILGVVHVEKGIVKEAPALRWINFPIKKELNSKFNFPIYIDNDVNISVLGEHWKGIGSTRSNLIYIAIGTGIGSGLIINNQLYRGSNYSAGEIGYMVTDKEHAQQYYPVYEGYGYLESVSSGSSIGSQLSKKLKKTLTAKEAFKLYEKNNKQAVEIIETAIENLGIGIANYISLFDPEMIVLGGGVSESYSLIINKMQPIIDRFTPEKCDVVKSILGKEAGVVGAVALFLKEHDSMLTIKGEG
ncbi:ROK family transcriptional regulator [Virgibacillus salarius]|uniref:ROK family transcriptional regulator n=1 Tax=Virgibacillus salarius TaxID=447199 RepID=UPI0024925CDD|nr:ROK family transcriptional regulator [Virgibacillus salarius]WBX78561.1 ROK family transcriptional regulator [Virgibacillus salarius]